MESCIMEEKNDGFSHPVGFVGYAANRHYSKICKDGNMTCYKTKRKFKNEEIIKDWRNLPSLSAVKKAINGYNNKNLAK